VIAASAVYVVSVLIGLACCVLLLRAHRRHPSTLLLSAAICFGGFALNDVGLISTSSSSRTSASSRSAPCRP